jgi:hypothetical protein
MNELDTLDAVPETITLSTGTVVQFEALKARQFFKLLRIVTHSATGMLGQIDNLFSGSGQDAAGRFAAMLLMSIPDAIDETVEFLFSMVKPAGLIDRPKLDKVQQQHNQALWDNLVKDLSNPELEDLVDLVEAIFKREADDLAALGKKLQKLLGLAQKTGQLKPQDNTSQTSQDQNSSEDSPEPSISSVQSTDGPTISLGNVQLPVLDNAPQPLPNVGI